MIKLFVLIICLLPSLSMGANTIDTTIIVFMEQEAQLRSDIESDSESSPYQTRFLVTKQYLRLDDGVGTDGYVLFDRIKNIIYNITKETKTVMTVEFIPNKVNPHFKLELSSTKMELPVGAPEVAGIKAQHYRLITNDENCSDVIAVKGFLDDAVNAMRDYNQVLASNNASTLSVTPTVMQTPCMLSMNIFHVNQNLQFGFPVQEWSQKGKSRSLISYQENQKQDVSLFRLPDQYEFFSIKDFREGRVKLSE